LKYFFILLISFQTWADQPRSDTGRSKRYVDVGVFGAAQYVDIAKLDSGGVEEPFAINTLTEIPPEPPPTPGWVRMVPPPSGSTTAFQSGVKREYFWKNGLCGFELEVEDRIEPESRGTIRKLFIPHKIEKGQRTKEDKLSKYTDICGWIDNESKTYTQAIEAYRQYRDPSKPCLSFGEVKEQKVNGRWKHVLQKYGLLREVVGRTCTATTGVQFKLTYHPVTLELAIKDMSPGGNIWYVNSGRANTLEQAGRVCPEYNGKRLPDPSDFEIAVSHGLLEAFGAVGGTDKKFWTHDGTRGFKGRSTYPINVPEMIPDYVRCINRSI
jgi:hypothetical protein